MTAKPKKDIRDNLAPSLHFTSEEEPERVKHLPKNLTNN